MSSSMRWPAYPDIPIFLEASEDPRTPKSYGTTPTTPTTPGRSSASEAQPSERPTHLQVPSVLALQPRDRSVVWPIPEPPPEIEQQPSRRPLLRFFPTDRPRVRFDGPRASQISAKTEFTDIEPEAVGASNKNDFGLGIMNGPPKPPSVQIPSPIDEKKESSPNIAQRIEQGLWRYSSSGNVLKRWLIEIISWFVSLICMSAIIGVLIWLRSKPLAKWSLSSFGLTLNAFISVLSKMAGASLILPVSEALGQLKWSWFQGNSKKMWDFEIFDEASRGPWGSTLLLIRTKGRALAAIGAGITLLSLALDPFFQQVVDFPDRWTVLQGNSSIPKVVRWEYRPGIEIKGAVRASQQNEDIQAVSKKFFYGNGTQPVPFLNGTRPEIPLSCPTSNCTWPPYETLAVCSQCADVSELLTWKCLEGKVDWTKNISGGIGAEKTYPTGSMCGYFLNATSDAPVMMSGYMVNPDGSTGEALMSRALPLITNPLRETLFGGSIKFKNVRYSLVDVVIAGAADSESVYRNEPPAIHECVLSWCVKRIQSSYDWARYKEEELHTFVNETAEAFPWNTTRIQTPAGNATSTGYFLGQNLTIQAHSLNGEITEYGLSNATAFRTITVFDEVFPSFTTVEPTSTEEVLRIRVGNTGPAILRTMDYNPWTQSNITHHMGRLATALTNVIRSTPGNNMVSGTAANLEAYVIVRWEWLTLPIGLLGLSLIFLVAVIVRTSMEIERVGVWKTSAIATLLYGLPDEMQRNITSSARGTGTPRAKAKELKVKLLPSKGWRISGNLLSPFTPNVRQNQPPPGWI